MNRMIKRVLCLSLAAVLALGLTACGSKTKPVDPQSCTYDEMVDYLTQEGYISEDAAPVNINETQGYVTDHTGGTLSVVPVADRAEDYEGLWLFWWDLENQTDVYEMYQSMQSNSGTIVIQGGAAVLETAGRNGAFAIAFAPDYAQKDAALAAFEALPEQQ